MKQAIIISIIGILSTFARGAVIAFWDFNSGYDAGLGQVQVVLNASQGSGTIYQQRADIDGNGKAGNAFQDSANGINVAAGNAMAWDDIAKAGENDAEFFITFSTVNFSNIVISFDLRGNATLIPGFDLKYSTSPLENVTNPIDVLGTIKDFPGGISTEIFNNSPLNAGAAFARISIDLSSVIGLNNMSSVALRLDNFDNGTGNNDMRIDNFLITAVPEPSVALLGVFGVFAMLRRRRLA
ncbi:MAG: hypothetical protein RLZZ553_204 [Verrucomicrobiota bacterium]|jgi:hypothetical protein